uniref:Uncharacterized protein n=1 Tax=Rhodnius prolixus TaxID=13249 RepID=T1IGC3_RHOPR
MERVRSNSPSLQCISDGQNESVFGLVGFESVPGLESIPTTRSPIPVSVLTLCISNI